jgi:hypothetical protein
LDGLSNFNDTAPLLRYGLLARTDSYSPASTPILHHEFRVPHAVVGWLLGRYQPSGIAQEKVKLISPSRHQDERDTPVPLRLAASQLDEFSRLMAYRPLLGLTGLDHGRKLAAARQLAASLGKPLLTVNLGDPIGATEDLALTRSAVRDAILNQALPMFTHVDRWIDSQGSLATRLLEEFEIFGGPILIDCRDRWRVSGEHTSRPVFWWDFSVPVSVERAQLWAHYLDEDARGFPEEISEISGQFALASTQIFDAVASARSSAFQQDRPLEGRDLFDAARAHSNPMLGQLARKINPRYGWEDLVLPEDQLAILHEIISTVRHRPVVLEKWEVRNKLASSAGVPILFAGEPGTGKTMSAEVIASELNLDLYKIDLSTVVSKYIGETEKNLEKIFHEAESSNAILFFDEADAIFGKRSEVKDAHDRYANIEISYLLQRMERYDGVTILATNLRANLDEAFTRRLHFVVDFPFPNEEERLRIWKTLLPTTIPIAGDVDLEFMADRFRLAGGGIRNIIVSAAYLAAENGGMLEMKHLLHGARRELQKMGRLLSERDLAVG